MAKNRKPARRRRARISANANYVVPLDPQAARLFLDHSRAVGSGANLGETTQALALTGLAAFRILQEISWAASLSGFLGFHVDRPARRRRKAQP